MGKDKYAPLSSSTVTFSLLSIIKGSWAQDRKASRVAVLILFLSERLFSVASVGIIVSLAYLILRKKKFPDKENETRVQKFGGN